MTRYATRGAESRLRRRHRAAQRGAVLLLLLLVLGVGAASALIGAFGGIRLQAAREQRTVLLLAEARDALTGYAAANGRLPRPAISATDGRENPAACASDAACAGFLPWVALGIDGADAWGKRLRYSVTPALTTYAFQPYSTVANRSVLRRDADGELAYVAGGPACAAAAARCVALVVLSQGRNNYGTSVTGIEQASGAAGNGEQLNNDEAENDTAVTRFVADVQGGAEFDDLVAWLPLDLLYRRMRAANTLPN